MRFIVTKKNQLAWYKKNHPNIKWTNALTHRTLALFIGIAKQLGHPMSDDFFNDVSFGMPKDQRYYLGVE